MIDPIAFILKGYPRLSETFIAQEIRALEIRGADIHIFSMRYPTDSELHPVHREIRAPVTYLPEYMHREPGRILRAWLDIRSKPGFKEAVKSLKDDLTRHGARLRIRRFCQAVVLSSVLPPRIKRLHAHFLHTPSTVAHYASLITGLPWSCSAHAKDIWTSKESEKREKLKQCNWLVTCTKANYEHLLSLTHDPSKIDLIYHGVDFSRFPPLERLPSDRNGSSPEDPVRLLSVGRAVEKKGYEDLLQALHQLPAEYHWQFIHIGGGELLKRLQKLGQTLKISDRLIWRGVQPQEVVLAEYRAADIFVLPCRITRNGDRDGLPNVLLEAQSQKLPCISTRISGIPELIEDGTTGILVPERDVHALSEALSCMITDPELRKRLGNAGFDRVNRDFKAGPGIDRLVSRFAPHS